MLGYKLICISEMASGDQNRFEKFASSPPTATIKCVRTRVLGCLCWYFFSKHRADNQLYQLEYGMNDDEFVLLY